MRGMYSEMKKSGENELSTMVEMTLYDMMKRVRLFEAVTPNSNAENESPLLSVQSLTLPNKQVQQDSVAVTVAKFERDTALAERDKAFAALSL